MIVAEILQTAIQSSLTKRSPLQKNWPKIHLAGQKKNQKWRLRDLVK